MWLFTKNSFVSIVSHRDRPGDCLVRARVRAHIERLFPDQAASITEDPNADYRYRLVASKERVVGVVSRYITEGLTYDNFKAAQDPEKDHRWIDFLHRIWYEGLKLE